MLASIRPTPTNRLAFADRLSDLQQMMGGAQVTPGAILSAAERLQDARLEVLPGLALIGQCLAAQRVHLAQHRVDKADDGGEIVLSSEPELEVRHLNVRLVKHNRPPAIDRDGLLCTKYSLGAARITSRWMDRRLPLRQLHCAPDGEALSIAFCVSKES